MRTGPTDNGGSRPAGAGGEAAARTGAGSPAGAGKPAAPGLPVTGRNVPAPREAPDGWTRTWLAETAARLERLPAEAILDWGVATFAPRICLATSFGPQTIVLMHWIAGRHPEVPVFWLDTGLLFPETHELRERLQRRLGIDFQRVPAALDLDEQASAFGEALWKRSPNQCCFLRKVLPLRHHLAGQHAWITGVRRGRNGFRSAARAIEWDETNRLVKLNPLVGWSRERVWDHLRRHELPTNALHEEGYPSIGCQPCTHPVADGRDPRSGRWSGFDKTECGIHGPGKPAGEAGEPR